MATEVTTIYESKYLTSTIHAELFGKLRGYEMDMTTITITEKDTKGK